MRLLTRAAAPARGLRTVGSPSSVRVVVAPSSFPTTWCQSSSRMTTPVRAFSSTPITFKKGGKDKGGKKDKSGGGAKKKGKEVDENETKGPTEEDLAQAIDKTKAKMDKTVEWAKGIVYEGVERGRGRVSPVPRPFPVMKRPHAHRGALLDGIKVATPEGSTVPLKAVASITAKQMTLLVEVWDSALAKAVGSAIHSANIPGLSPQQDGDVMRIPVSRPTGDVRASILRNLADTVEQAKNQVRVARTEGLKALGGRGEDGTDEVQQLADKATAEVDKMLQTAKKEFEKA